MAACPIWSATLPRMRLPGNHPTARRRGVPASRHRGKSDRRKHGLRRHGLVGGRVLAGGRETGSKIGSQKERITDCTDDYTCNPWLFLSIPAQFNSRILSIRCDTSRSQSSPPLLTSAVAHVL